MKAAPEGVRVTTDKPYNRTHFEALYHPLHRGDMSRNDMSRNDMRVDDAGVWPAFDHETACDKGLLGEYEVLMWKPILAFADDLPNLDAIATPGLPFPFDARQLAAFMLDGVGSFIADYYGGLEDGLDEKAIKEIDPGNRSAIRAVREAFEAYRQARTAVGCQDGEWPDTDSMVRQLLTPTPESDVVTVGEVPDTKPVSEPPEWKARAAKRAVEIIASDRKKDFYPSKKDIADSIAKEFRAAGVVGTGGKPLTGAYIKRHALNGISSEQGKRLSTATHRGKWGRIY